MKQNPSVLRLVAATIVVTTALSGCTKTPEASVAAPVTATPAGSISDGNVSDGDVTTRVTTALHQQASLKSADIAVETKKGDVRLTGALDSQAQIDEAISIARAVDGAHSIHDELTLKNPTP